jgi:hypothetical protein
VSSNSRVATGQDEQPVAKSASELLNDVEQQGLVPPQVVASLRSQVAHATQSVSAQSVADLLVQKSLLTPAQRDRLFANSASTADLFDDVEPLEPIDAAEPLHPLRSAAPLADLSTAPDPFAAPLAALQPASAPGSPQANASSPPKRSWLLLAVVSLLLVALAGGGTAAALLLMPRGDGSAEFAAAEADFQAGAWQAAIATYDTLLGTFPNSPHASLARVRRGLAKVHAAQSSGGAPAAVLAVTRDAIPPLADEPALAEARGELAPLLTELALKLVDAAQQSGDPQSVAAAEQALELVNDGRLVPGDLRNWEELADAEEALAALKYEQSLAGARSAAIAAIDEAAASGDASAMVMQVNVLRSLAPAPEVDELLPKAFEQLAKACQAKVVPLTEVPQPTSEERPSAATGSVTLVLPQPAGGEGIEVTLAAGSAWGIDRGSGQISWRRSIGESRASMPREFGDNVILVDRRHNELIGVAKASGKFRWRLPLASSVCGEPHQVGGELVVTTRDGRILLVDPATGEVRRGVALPQGARASAWVDTATMSLWQAADFGLVYRLSAGDLTSTAAIPLGHAPASVAAAPVRLAERLAIAENSQPGQSILHLVELSPAGEPTGTIAHHEVAGDIVELAAASETLQAKLADGQVLSLVVSMDEAAELIAAGVAPVKSGTRPALVRLTGLAASASGDGLEVETEQGTMVLPLAAFEGPAIQPFVPAAAAAGKRPADPSDSAILAEVAVDEPIVVSPVILGGAAYVGTPAGEILRFALPEPPPEMP